MNGPGGLNGPSGSRGPGGSVRPGGLGGAASPVGPSPTPSRPGADIDATAVAPLPPALRIGPDGGAFVPPEVDEFGSAEADANRSGEIAPVIRTANLVHRPPTRGTVLTLATLIVALLVVLPTYLVLRQGGSGNPAFRTMSGLGVPDWASRSPHDAAIYSRFCVDECQISERDAGSTKSTTDTELAYAQKLQAQGWTQAAAANCTSKVTGSYTCWLLDARELDLWVRPSTCGVAPPPNETGLPDDTTPSHSPSNCVPTDVQIKIFDQIERSRVRTSSSG